MRNRRIGASLALLALLASCGGDSMLASAPAGTGAGTGATTGSTATPTPTASTGCSLRERQDWAAAQLREWYLFPETLPASLDPTPYTTVDGYIDALTATARSQRRDRYFTYLTSIRDEDAYYQAGENAGFGFRLGIDGTARRAFIIESFEGGAALAAQIDRGAEIVAIGTSAATLRTVSAIFAAEGGAGVSAALGPNSVGTSRVLQISDAQGTRTVTLAKTDFALLPVSTRYGAKVITDGGRNYGYLNLRTFISTADPALRAAFAGFRAQNVTDIVIDLRYNGGGLISIAELMTDLLGRNRATSEVSSYTTFRTEKSANNTTRFFAPQPESIAPTRVAFIGTGGTASASELVINAMIPYLHSAAGLIGTNTYGKPVGQIGLDRAACDDRLRVVALSTQNAARQGAYYDGLAGTVEASCRAEDDIRYPLGDPREASTRQAIDFLAGRSCLPVTATAATASARTSTPTPTTDLPTRALLIPDHPTTPQREVPGLY